MHPAKNATRPRRGPRAAKVLPNSPKKNRSSIAWQQLFPVLQGPRASKCPSRVQSTAGPSVDRNAAARCCRNASRKWQQPFENKMARCTCEPTVAGILLRFAPAPAPKFPVFDTGRARSFAIAAIQASIDMVDESARRLRDCPSSTSTICRIRPRGESASYPHKPVRRAIIRAKPTVHASRIIIVLGLVSRAEPTKRERKLPPRVIVR